MSQLRAHKLTKSYRSREVVKEVSMDLNSGEVVGLLGPNGAGKTTCFYMIVGLIPSDSGRIELDDHDLTQLPMHSRARYGIGYLPQEASVFRKLSVADNIMGVLETRRDLSDNPRLQREELLEALLQEFHITHIRDSLGMSLSGGERRRVEIARALATDPRFIFLDEPFAGVDPISVVDIQEIIKHLKARGIGVFITDHNVRETLGICERGYIMGEGRLIAQGNPEQLLADEQVREIYLGKTFTL